MPIQEKRRYKAASLSIGLSLLVLGLKTWAFVLTGSTAIKSDAIESIVNVMASLIALAALWYAARPADDNHPYGHGKIEFFSAVIEGVLVTLAAGFILFESSLALIQGTELRNLGKGLWITVSAGSLNGLLGWYLIRAGRETRSMALEADGKHLVGDFLTTVGILMGLLLVQITGWSLLDPLMGVFVGLLLGRMGFVMLKSSSGALLDEEDRELLETLLQKINEWPVEEIISLHRLRAMRAGSFAHVDVHLIVPEYMDVREAHAHVHRFSERLSEMSGMHGEWHTHFEPCRKRYCSVCPIQSCPIRQRSFVARKSLSLEEAISTTETIPDLA
jgi:cation diffusion facilitator family transporter